MGYGTAKRKVMWLGPLVTLSEEFPSASSFAIQIIFQIWLKSVILHNKEKYIAKSNVDNRWVFQEPIKKKEVCEK